MIIISSKLKIKRTRSEHISKLTPIFEYLILCVLSECFSNRRTTSKRAQFIPLQEGRTWKSDLAGEESLCLVRLTVPATAVNWPIKYNM
jgi:hypothetical protein